MGMPKMNVPAMLANFMHMPAILGWAAHFMIGISLAVGYAVVFQSRLPGNPAVKGLIYSIFPWLMAQLIVMPMMGMSVFSGSVVMAMGSLVAHFIFGAVVGSIYRPQTQGRMVAETGAATTF